MTSIKRVTHNLATNFVCTSCTILGENGVEPIENLCDGVETVNEFCYLDDKLKTSGRCGAAVTARMRIGWIKFRECSELFIFENVVKQLRWPSGIERLSLELKTRV